MLDSLDSSAALLGAVNTVRVQPDGTLRGYNTDGPGFVRAVLVDFGFDVRGQRVLIFGAGGGAGRAIAAQCVASGCAAVILVNRTVAKARELAATLGAGPHSVHVLAWNDASVAGALASVDLIVNASTVGLHNDGSELPSLRAAPLATPVFDTVYRASGEPTRLVADALAAGRPAAGGLSLLLYQGALAFEHWFGRPAPIDAMRAALTKG
jgi:shikimate dehydrogenase